ncbi:MAG TPA: tagatose 1,6-diphosphate aldolase [Propionibacteriaceae bacterium]|nr:tagatose 1,6-diphosphate aldolase [Propionibacteriaceae bacterium]
MTDQTDRTSRPDLGVLRRLGACADRQGFFTVLAIDHPPAFILPPSEAARNDQAEAVAVKAELAEAMAPHASALLVDPDSGLPACLATGLLPGDVGLMLCIEGDEYQREPDAHRISDVRGGWSVAKLARTGGDACKLLWRYRHEVPEAEAHRAFVRQLALDCAVASMPFVVEPIWAALPGEDLADPQVAAARARGIVDYAKVAQDLGADLVKTEFPGGVDSEAAREQSAAACSELDESLEVPWLVLSAGVTYDAFRVQTEIAARAGASGFIGGRAIWDTVVTPDRAARRDGVRTAVQRLAELTAIVHEHGRPWRATQSVAEVTAAYPSAWYAD